MKKFIFIICAMIGVPSFALDGSYQYECTGVSGFTISEKKLELIDLSKIANVYISFWDNNKVLSLYEKNRWKVSHFKSLSDGPDFQQFGQFYNNNFYEIYQVQKRNNRVATLVRNFSQPPHDWYSEEQIADMVLFRVIYSCNELK